MSNPKLTLLRVEEVTYEAQMFADPYKICDECDEWIDGAFRVPGGLILLPCHHRADYTDVCPSWSPVDGCRCVEHLGRRAHPLRPDRDESGGAS